MTGWVGMTGWVDGAPDATLVGPTDGTLVCDIGALVSTVLVGATEGTWVGLADSTTVGDALGERVVVGGEVPPVQGSG